MFSVKNFELFDEHSEEFSKFRKQAEKQIPKGTTKEGPFGTFQSGKVQEQKK